ncbi:MAG: 4a-hydroxytetrahydrobiopterin dehydratase [bacterium]|nr:4a-hydroxytetrahydrobiopterin dehydratase [bacterium]
MSTLTQSKCEPCEGGIPPMTREQFEPLLQELPGWKVTESEKTLARDFSFKNFVQTIEFVNKVAELAEQEGHHPDLNIHGYNKLAIRLSTHAIKGLSRNDFILAAKIDQLA